jgi:hypothetical protein
MSRQIHIYEIDSWQQKYFLEWAKSRNNSKSKSQNKRYTQKIPEEAEISGDIDVDINYWGIISEVAVAEHLNVSPDFSISKLGDGGKKDLTYKGKSLQIKNTFHKGGDLFFNEIKQTDSKSYYGFYAYAAILTEWRSKNSIKIVGYITRQNFLKGYTDKDFGYGKRYCLGQKKLTPLRGKEHYCLS